MMFCNMGAIKVSIYPSIARACRVRFNRVKATPFSGCVMLISSLRYNYFYYVLSEVFHIISFFYKDLFLRFMG
jgi:hypothetical protein